MYEDEAEAARDEQYAYRLAKRARVEAIVQAIADDGADCDGQEGGRHEHEVVDAENAGRDVSDAANEIEREQRRRHGDAEHALRQLQRIEVRDVNRPRKPA